MIRNKLKYSFEDYKNDIPKILSIVSSSDSPKVFVPYKGGLPLGVKIANSLNSPLGILEFQRYDTFSSSDSSVSLMKSIDINLEDDIWLVDDIYDEGVTIKECVTFLRNEFPKNDIYVLTIFRHKKHNDNPNEYYIHSKNDEWIIFEPWE